MDTPKYFYLWAKTDKSSASENTHPLIFHMLDVGICALALWNFSLSEQTQRTFANFLDLDSESTGRLLAFWASLHDIGKAAPGFQRKYPPAVPLLKERGFAFPDPTPRPAHHGQVSAWALETLLLNVPGHTKQISKKIGRAVGGHHGTWPLPGELQALARQIGDTGEGNWNEARIEIVQAISEVFSPPHIFRFPENQQDENALLTLLSGLVSVADWIGSMAEYFPFQPQYISPKEYATRSATLAKDTLHRLGWIGWQADGTSYSFIEMFPSFLPRPEQKAVINVAMNVTHPALLILEAPTGSGKTETALFLADNWLQTNLGRGIYIAMPTQATSNQMFGRVEKYLFSRYPQETINYQLVHGGALLAEYDFDYNPVDIADDESAPQSGSLRAQAWFLPRKRTLLAPFGVGTVDQALMSVLQTRHFFVRMFGLGQKILVFDEIHAYDTYMSTLFERLLAWLRTIGTSVILLSATLPESTRSKLAAAWLGKKQVVLPQADYPRLTEVSDGEARTFRLPAPEQHSLALSWIEGEPHELADHLVKRLSGGCAAIICNRVARAQEVYLAVKKAGVVEPKNLILFHARYPFAWREGIEKHVLKLFSKDGQRPKKAVVVATQVIEQSLDLDFDYVITDLPPIDLLIQRAGRLHRHSHNDAARPSGLQIPQMDIAQPLIKDAIPDFGRDEFIYERFVLLRTWLALRERTSLILPHEISALIESVYGELSPPEDPAIAHALAEAEHKARGNRREEIVEAKRRMIPDPDDEDLLYGRNEGLEEEDIKIHKTFRALTRLAEPGVKLICLHRDGDFLSLEPNGKGGRVDLDKMPDRQLTRQLLRRAVTVQRFDVVDYFANRGEHPAWKDVAALRYHYPIIFDEDGRDNLEGTSFTLFLSRETGLEIRKESA